MAKKIKTNKKELSPETLNKTQMGDDSSFGIPDPLNYKKASPSESAEGESNDERTDQDRINETHDRIRQWYEYHQENVWNMQKNRQFVFIKQWDDAEEGKLLLAGKPILQSNKIYDVIIKMSGEYRHIGGELKPISINHKATEDEIQLNSDFLRTIYFNSNSQLAYYQAFDDVLIGGFGCYGIGTMYESYDSSHQIPYLYAIKEPDKCVFDLNAKKVNKEDGEFCMRHITYTRKAFEKMYPDVAYPSSFPTPYNPISFTWGSADTITVVEQYEKEWYEFNLNILSDGREVRDEEWKKIEEQNKLYDTSGLMSKLQYLIGAQMPQIPQVSISKTIKKKACKIKLRKMIASQIIEEKEFPGNQLPLIFVPGPSTVINGLERFCSVPTFARDPQRLHNYVMIEIAHSLQINRKERFMATKANINNYKEMWENPLDIQGALMYEPDPITHQAPIQLNTYEVPQTLIALYNQFEMAIQNTIGFFDANRGKDTAEKSGIAIARQQMAGSLSTSVAKSNMDLAIAQGGKVIMGMRRDLFDQERTMVLLGSNKKNRVVRINRPVANGEMENNLSKGDYNVVFESGPTQQMQKEMQLDFMIKIAEITQQPNLVADLLAEMGDALPSFVERMRTLVPPEIIAKEDGKPAPPAQPNPQLILMQKQLELKDKEIEIEKLKIQVELGDLQVKMQKIQADKEIADMKARAEVGKAGMENHAGMIDATAKIISSNNDLRKEVHKHLSGK